MCSVRAEILSIGRYFSVYFFIHLFLRNLGVLNVHLLNNILDLVTFTFKLAKHKMAAKMLIKPRIFYGLSHMKAQLLMISGIFIIYIECLWKEITFN